MSATKKDIPEFVNESGLENVAGVEVEKELETADAGAVYAADSFVASESQSDMQSLASADADAVQTVVLDFDGAEDVSYANASLSIVREGVYVKASGLTAAEQEYVVSQLNLLYSGKGVVFALEAPADGEYSTVYVGSSDSFADLGSFTGLSETVDIGNENRSDSAFVLLDSSSGVDAIISTIDHEVGHLTGALDHGGAGIAAYAEGAVELVRGDSVVATYTGISEAVAAAQSGDTVRPTAAVTETLAVDLSFSSGTLTFGGTSSVAISGSSVSGSPVIDFAYKTAPSADTNIIFAAGSSYGFTNLFYLGPDETASLPYKTVMTVGAVDTRTSLSLNNIYLRAASTLNVTNTDVDLVYLNNKGGVNLVDSTVTMSGQFILDRYAGADGKADGYGTLSLSGTTMTVGGGSYIHEIGRYTSGAYRYGKLILTDASSLSTASVGGGITIELGSEVSLSGDSSLTFGGAIVNRGSMVFDSGSTLTYSGTFANTGTITINASAASNQLYKVIDSTGSAVVSDYGAVLTGAPAGYSLVTLNNDLFLANIDMSKIYVDSSLTDKSAGDVVTVNETDYYYGFNAFSDTAGVADIVDKDGTVYIAGGNSVAYSDFQPQKNVTIKTLGTDYAVFNMTLGHQSLVFLPTDEASSTASVIAEGSKIKAASIGTNPKVDGAFVSGVTVSLTIDGEVIVGDDSSSSKSIGNVWNRQNGTLTVSESGSLTVLGGQLSNRGDIVVYGALTREVWSGTGTFALAGTSLQQGNFTIDGGTFTETSLDGATSFVTVGENTSSTGLSYAKFKDSVVTLVSGVVLGGSYSYTTASTTVGSASAVSIEGATTFKTTGDFYIESGTSLTLSAASTLTAKALTNSGTFTVDATGFTTGTKKIVDLTSISGTAINVTNLASGISAYRNSEGDVILSDASLSTIYVNSAWSGLTFGDAIEGKTG